MRERNYQLEVLRVISCINVVLIHVCNVYSRSFDVISGGEFMFSTFFNCMARTSVPIFFMISGATSLGSQYDVKKYKDKVKGIAVMLIVASVFYYFWDILVIGESYNLKDLFYAPVKKLLWYLYAYLGILIVLPFLQKMFANMEKKWELIFLGLWIGYMAFQRMTTFMDMDIKYPLPILGTTYYVGYFVLGYVLNKYMKEIKIKDRWLYLIRYGSLAIIWTLTCVISFHKNKYFVGFTNYSSVLMALQSAAMFVMIGRRQPRHYTLMGKDIVATISMVSFNIYLIHPIFLDLIKIVMPFTERSAYWMIPFALIVVFMCSAISAYAYILLKKKVTNKNR